MYVCMCVCLCACVHTLTRSTLQAAKLVCAPFAPIEEGSPTAAAAGRWGSNAAAAAAAAAPNLYVRISHAALPYIILQLLELLQMSDKTEFYFNSRQQHPPPPPPFPLNLT